MTFGEFHILASDEGLHARSLDSGRHWQLIGGKNRVNYCPSTGSIHVENQSRKVAGTPRDAIKAALNGLREKSRSNDGALALARAEIAKLQIRVQEVDKRTVMWQHAYYGAVEELDELKKWVAQV